MNYRESRAFIADAAKYGSVLGLDTMRELMRRLGDPQDSLKFVHVAGTNGKGSVTAYLYTTLTQAGYRVGRYISPAMYSYRERMEVCRKQVTEEEFARIMTEVSCAAGEMASAGMAHPTIFELETAAAFLFFLEKHCDLVLLEVGMGGNLDATNLVKNTCLAVFTSISIDHQAFLGNTLKEIAEKKSGILKPGCLAVSAPQRLQVRQVLNQAAAACGLNVRYTDAGKAVVLKESLYGQRFSYQGECYDLQMAGVCQIENAVLALKALELLQELGFPTDISQRKHGLENTFWNGRFTVIHEYPTVIVDGAHNPDAAGKLVQSISRYLKGKTIYYIMGVFRDKDYEEILRLTCPWAKKIRTIQTPENARALPAGELAAAAQKYHPLVSASASLEAAVAETFEEAAKEDVILAFGSLSFISELTEIVKRHPTMRVRENHV